ncbi:hypothetical protein [Shigella dysenteriae]|nr:hypothetical protein [Shigella dysenteriae]
MNVNAGHERTSKARIIHQIQLIRGITVFFLNGYSGGIYDAILLSPSWSCSGFCIFIPFCPNGIRGRTNR